MSETRQDAKRWLRENGYAEVAEWIEDIEAGWKRDGLKTRRNWWDVLAGTKAGKSIVVADREFPVLIEARRRQGLPLATFPVSPVVATAADAGSRAADTFKAADAGGRDAEPAISFEMGGSEEELAVANEPAAGPSGEVSGERPAPDQQAAPVTGPGAAETAAAVEAAGDLLDSGTMQYLARQIERGRVVLVTGAGFSMDARDKAGRSLPSAAALARELWDICYPGEVYDDSTFGDLYAYAARHRKSELREYLLKRLTVDPVSLGQHYLTWFAQPWRRAYTLNYDDLELAAAQRFDLPREPQPVSATADLLMPHLESVSGRTLSVIHLNGFLLDNLRDMTASPQQYGIRLGKSEPWYEALVAELAASTCIYVGTQLDEPVLWKYIELRGTAQGVDTRPRSFLIIPGMSKARRAMLADYRVQLVPAKASDFAQKVLAKLSAASQKGLERLSLLSPSPGSGFKLPDVDALLRSSQSSKTEFLLGEQPVWSDVVSSRMAVRGCDADLLASASVARRTDGRADAIILTGTAGTGKSSTAMKLAARLVALGWSVGWLGADMDVAPNVLRQSVAGSNYDAVFVDDIDRYGRRSAGVLSDIASGTTVRLVFVTVRASRSEVLDTVAHLETINAQTVAIPQLTDGDIDSLIDALAADHKLGKLTGKSREKQREEFRSRADRQLLVALIEATSGRKFEEKIFDEWEDLAAAERAAYAVIALANSLRANLSREDILLCLFAKYDKSAAHAAMQNLVNRRLVINDPLSDRLRARHRVIAETLLDELSKHNSGVQSACEELAYAVASKVSPVTHLGGRRTQSERLLIRLLNHKHLIRRLNVDGARKVYAAVEEVVGKWDHHFWLQRGSLELEEGAIQYADRYLNTAYSLAPGDQFVVTAYAYMLMKRAQYDPRSQDAEESLSEGAQLLRAQIASRGISDDYPYHVLGSQSVAWVSRCSWSREQKLNFLKSSKRDVDGGLRHHPRSRDLQSLSVDMQKKIVALQAGLAD